MRGRYHAVLRMDRRPAGKVEIPHVKCSFGRPVALAAPDIKQDF
jgi:hypothetical protein